MNSDHSVMNAAGPVAQTVSDLAWLLFGGGSLIFIGVMLLLAFALRRPAARIRPRLWVLGGGVAFPTVVLAALFAWTLPLKPAPREAPPAGALLVTVTAHMWWWEVRYPAEDGSGDVITANEIRIPVGRPVYLALASSDVIHSFWVPALAGKMDMVPGRIQHLLLSADRAGIYRGQCAEYCGEQHARMALHVVAQAPEEFAAWRAGQSRAATVATSAQQLRGQQVFLANRCDACHSVRGVTGESRLAPDLTHLASRSHLAAGTLPNDPQALAQWVAHVQDIKPGARMPSYDRLDAASLTALAGWLASLQ